MNARRVVITGVGLVTVVAAGGLLIYGVLALAQRVQYQTIVGVDIAEPYIEAARERTNNPQIEFRVGPRATSRR